MAEVEIILVNSFSKVADVSIPSRSPLSGFCIVAGRHWVGSYLKVFLACSLINQ